MPRSHSGSPFAAICLLLAAPASLTILSGDPSNPNLLGLAIAVTAVGLGIQAFRRTTTATVAFLWALAALALLTWPFSPNLPGSPGRNATAAGWLLYLGIVKPGSVLVFAVAGLFAVFRARDQDAVVVQQDAGRCTECGMLPPDHTSWCVAARANLPRT